MARRSVRRRFVCLLRRESLVALVLMGRLGLHLEPSNLEITVLHMLIGRKCANKMVVKWSVHEVQTDITGINRPKFGEWTLGPCRKRRRSEGRRRPREAISAQPTRPDSNPVCSAETRTGFHSAETTYEHATETEPFSSSKQGHPKSSISPDLREARSLEADGR